MCVPCSYIKLIYAATFPPLPTDLKGDTFVRIFGTRTTSLVRGRRMRGVCRWLAEYSLAARPSQEHFILKRELMGPSWLKVKEVCALPRHE